VKKKLLTGLLKKVLTAERKICLTFALCKPRIYRDNAGRDYLSLAWSKERTVKKIRKATKSSCSISAATVGLLMGLRKTDIRSVKSKRNGSNELTLFNLDS
jgi:hypothetical protein